MAPTAEAPSQAVIESLRRVIDAWPIDASKLERTLVAWSGGLDSTFLLAAMQKLALSAELVAVHIDHGLHPDSDRWARHCESYAERVGVASIAKRVEVAARDGRSIEEAAREARYRALRDLVRAGDIVLTAHHGDDQLETVLLRMLRGSGVRGMTGIHACIEFGTGYLGRPLLDLSRREIETEARAWGLEWLEDPSNTDLAFDRNFLRAQVLPVIGSRWPRAHSAAQRLAQHMADAERLLAELADIDVGDVDDPGCFPVARVAALSSERQSNALRHLIRRVGLPVPTTVQLNELKSALVARPDAQPLVAWAGAEARVYRGALYLMPPLPAAGEPEGSVEMVPSDAYGIPDAWVREGLQIRVRIGGERFLPERATQHKSLKHWFQEQGIVPWMRERVPLLYRGDTLVAVGDLAVAGRLPQGSGDAPFWRPHWKGHRRVR